MTDCVPYVCRPIRFDAECSCGQSNEHSVASRCRVCPRSDCLVNRCACVSGWSVGVTGNSRHRQARTTRSLCIPSLLGTLDVCCCMYRPGDIVYSNFVREASRAISSLNGDLSGSLGGCFICIVVWIMSSLKGDRSGNFGGCLDCARSCAVSSLADDLVGKGGGCFGFVAA